MHGHGVVHLNKDFVDHGYAYIPNVLDRESCDFLTSYIFDCVYKEQLYIHDNQCPLSYGVSGTWRKPFLVLLDRMKPHMETWTGLKLLPSYYYSRLYQPNDELKEHTDRESCEISMTLTLGYEGNVWGFYVKNKKFDINIGDAVIYKGCEIPHKRNKYIEGYWQTQVFLHYVDANGKNKNHANDSLVEKIKIPQRTNLKG